MGFNFSEEEISSMYGVYQNALDAVQEQTKKIVEQITAKARQLEYELMIKLSIEAVTYYNEELKNSELSALREWQSSDVSFTSIMEKLSAGEDAKDRSRILEARIEEEIQSWREVDSSQLSAIVKRNPKCNTSDIQEILEIVNQFIVSLEEQQKQYMNLIENKKEENTIYVSIEPVVVQSIAIVREGFRSGISASFSELAQEVEKRDRELKSMGETVAQNVASKSQNFASSGVLALKAKVKTILE